MIGTGFLFYFGAEWLTSIFLVDAKQEVATVTIRLLQMVSISMPSLALMIILNGALRGAGDTRWPLLFTFVGLICIRIPLAYWLAKEQVEIPHPGNFFRRMGAWDHRRLVCNDRRCCCAQPDDHGKVLARWVAATFAFSQRSFFHQASTLDSAFSRALKSFSKIDRNCFRRIGIERITRCRDTFARSTNICWFWSTKRIAGI